MQAKKEMDESTSEFIKHLGRFESVENLSRKDRLIIKKQAKKDKMDLCKVQQQKG